MATGQVIGKCHRRYRHQEFLKFLDHVDATLVKEPDANVHIILDNYATHKTPAVKRWFLIHNPGDGVYSVLGRIPDPAEDRP